MLASMETVGAYVASVETAEYREYVTAHQETVAAGVNATPEQQERTELLRVRAQRAAARYPAP